MGGSDLHASLDAARAQQRMYQFDTASSRRQLAGDEEEIAQLRDESSGVWAAFGPRLAELRDYARAVIEIHSAKCDSEMLKRECNVLRLLVESGWEMHADAVAPTTPQMLSKTPVSLRLRTGSPNLKIPTRKLNFAAQAEEACISASTAAAPVSELAESVVLPSSRQFVLHLEPAAAASEKMAPAPASVALLPTVSLPAPISFLSSLAVPVLDNAAPASPVPPPTPAVVEPSAAASVEPKSSDDVPAEIRSFGSSLSMLHNVLGDGMSNVSIGSLSLDASSNSSLQLASAPSISVVAPSAAPAPVARSSVRERLQRLVRERVLAKKEEDEQQRGSPATRNSASPHVEQLAWSPVVATENVTTNVSDLSLMMNDREAKISLSFMQHLDEAPAPVNQVETFFFFVVIFNFFFFFRGRRCWPCASKRSSRSSLTSSSWKQSRVREKAPRRLCACSTRRTPSTRSRP